MSILIPESAQALISESRQLMTNIDKEYDMSQYDFPEPDPFADPKAKPTFAGPHKEIYNQHYVQVNTFDKFPEMPDPDDFATLEEYQLHIHEWEQEVASFSEKIALPQTISHVLPRPTRPEIIPKADREDPVMRAKLKRTFNPMTSPAQPGNQMAVEKILLKGTPYEETDNLPYAGLNEKPVPINAYIESKNSWASELIPQMPDPMLYEYFDDYEDASIRWAKIVQNLEIIPPSPTELGNLTDLPFEGSSTIVAPFKPKDPVKPPKPFTQFECSSKGSKKALKKLFKYYKRTQKALTTPTLASEKVKNLHHSSKTYTPPHAGSIGITAPIIQQAYMQFGVPLTPFEGFSSTQMRRRELITLDVGYLAQPDLYDSGSINAKTETANLANQLNKDVKQFLITDLSPKQYQSLLYEKLPSGDTVGSLLAKKLSVENLVKYSLISNSIRFLSRCSITAQYFLGLQSTSEQVLDLLLPHLERFVALLTFSTPYSFILPELPDEELIAAISESPKSDQQLEQMANDFRQAQLLKCLQSIVFTSPDRFFPFFQIIRPLIHKCFCRLSDIVMSDVTFPLISEGFLNEKNSSVHMFYFRLLRTIVEAEYSRLIRVFAIHDLLKFIKHAVTSQSAIIRRDASSLWQLMMHTDSSLALRIQILNQKPSIILTMLKESQPIIQRYIIDVFTLFRCNNAEFDYRPFPLPLYKNYVDSLCPELQIKIKEPEAQGDQTLKKAESKEQKKQDKFKQELQKCSHLKNPYNVRALTLLLGMMRDYQSIYCKDRNELKEYVNSFITKRSNLLTEYKLSDCLKILYKNDLLEPSKANQISIWAWIFDTILSKDTESPKRLSLWRTFSNALLYQRDFMSFILQNPDLTTRFEKAFNSLDENVSFTMILILPSLAQKLYDAEKKFGNTVEQFVKNNLEEFFRKLCQPDVRISGRILAAYQSKNTSTIMAQVHSSLVIFLKTVINAHEKSSPKDSMLSQFFVSVLDNQEILKPVIADIKQKTVLN
ncbi:hypothetical protein TVAG_432530 [Trichomonas vaginalis G3]|uniref:Uncharacterized protein n=1 Tax=Trichomonas vaginalis (strain ATCC PRA-98 / G3) TaxID=412133 RepID=A2DIP4_TRIV3|nr:SCA1 complex scaffold protein SCAA family [Trichomonas vaginalis G3]EAY19657.1 hypothetical protein TVAG_432530 [Trichomonas vaginalis G3]KAI5521323.1 SCA1 complex scaffold protein SCAA family [Trichomonas vaginalis G3]|eukprot:XP_001580643.1 hypothetical protein [Trichomonas vaginalis G3]